MKILCTSLNSGLVKLGGCGTKRTQQTKVVM